MTDLMTTSDVADVLRVSPETVLRWHHAKKLPGGARMPSGALRFRRTVLEEWLTGGGDRGNDAPMSNLHTIEAA